MNSTNSYLQDTACTSRFEITDVLVHGTEGRTGSDASPLHGAARTGKPLRLHGVARMYGCCLTANRTSILQQNLSHRDPNEPGSARPAVRELHSSTDLHGMPDLDHCTELHGTEPMQRHCKLHVGARHCTAVSCITQMICICCPMELESRSLLCLKTSISRKGLLVVSEGSHTSGARKQLQAAH